MLAQKLGSMSMGNLFYLPFFLIDLTYMEKMNKFKSSEHERKLVIRKVADLAL